MRKFRAIYWFTRQADFLKPLPSVVIKADTAERAVLLAGIGQPENAGALIRLERVWG